MGTLTVVYHSSKPEGEDTRPPYMEDCAEWIAKFFKVDELDVVVNSIFSFGEAHTPVLSLPFPLITENKSLAGSQVTGLSIELPKGEALRRALLQVHKKEIIIIGNTKANIKLKSFNLRTQLSRVSSSVMKLVKKKEGES